MTVETVIFPKIYQMYRELLTQDNVILVEGKLNIKDDRPVIIADRISSAKNLPV